MSHFNVLTVYFQGPMTTNTIAFIPENKKFPSKRSKIPFS